MADNSVTLNWSGQTAAVPVTSLTAYSNTIQVENNSGQMLFARTDGVAAALSGGVGVPGTVGIPNGAVVELDNTQPLPNWNTKPNQDQSESVGTSVQSGFTAATSVSLIPASAATGTVNVTFQ